MKGIRFYADLGGTLQQPEDTSGRYGDKPLLPLGTTRKKLREYAASGGKLNCLALFEDNRCDDGSWEALVSVFGYADSDVGIGAVAWAVLRKQCRRIDEALARQLHPRLFARLDASS